ncbi:DUF928 domain-containing protein [Lyngbya aestuarii]|uniref:DUF928 domain-containing protein n=1 Tax=Lyngbya aestuarii TaxID=118322 RepID=UPI00403DCDA5
MNLTQSLFRQILLTSSLTTLLLSGVGFPLASSEAARKPRWGNPRSQPAGGRSPCPVAVSEKVLTALVDGSADAQPLLTTQERPTFLFYIPFSRAWKVASQDGQTYNVTTAEFELLDENENSVLKNPKQKIVFSLPEKPGIVKVTLPSTEASLEPDKEYFWVFRIICDENDNTANPSVAGWIKRVRGDSSSNVWFDRVEQLAQSPANYLDQWRQLLIKVDSDPQALLRGLTQNPIVELKPEAPETRREEDNACRLQPTPD